MADGTVKIDVILESEQAQQKSKELDEMLSSIGEDAGDKVSDSIKKNMDELANITKAKTEEITSDIKEIPKKTLITLKTQAEKQGIINYTDLLKRLPKATLTKLISKANSGEVINYEKLLKQLPAQVITNIKLNDNASPQLTELQHKATETEHGFSRLHDAVLGSFVGNVAANGFSALSGYISSAAHEALNASDAMNKFKSTMKLGGWGEKEIQSSAKEVQKYANDTVYELSDVSNTAAQLASNGIKNYMQLTEAAGNLNAQAGGTAETFKSVAMVMTQTAGEGKLTTENWNQLTDAIPGASGVLQEQMKKNGAYTGNFRDAMAQGKISADDLNKAMLQLGSNKGAVEAAKSTSTFEGAFGNLRAQVVTGIQEMIEQLGKKRMTDIINTITDSVLGLTKFILKLFEVISEHKKVAVSLGAVLTAVFATKKISDFIVYLGRAKDALTEFGLAAKAMDAIGDTASPVTSIGKETVATGTTATAPRLLSLASRTVPIATAAISVGSELMSNNNTGQKIGGSAGSIAGTALGAFAGSFLDPIMGPAGTAIGSMAGGWLGKKIGEAAGNAANKEMAGHSIVAHTKVKIDTDTSGQSRAIRPDLNQVARTVIKMDVDSKSIAQTKTKTDKLYSDMSKSLKKYYDDKEKRSQKDLQQLVKEGAITQQQANRKLKAERDADQKRIKQEQSTLNSMQKATNNHYKKLQNIESGQTKKLLDIERKYGKNSKQYNQERVREIQKENQRYTKILVRDQMKADRSINASVKKGASQQEKIYKDLIKRKGKLSQQDLKQTQRDADKQYRATVRPAQKAKDEVIKNANEKYSQTTKTAKKEWKENGTISGKQYREIKRNADRQRDDTIDAAKDQYNGVTKQAREQHKKVTGEINKQKDEVVNAANTQAVSHGAAAGQEYTLVNANVQSGQKKTAGIMNGFHKSVNNMLKALSANQSIPMVGYATGTGALTKDRLAMVGEEGFELAHTPRGYEVLGANGPELRYLSAGTSILTHAQSKAAMVMNGGKLPGYAKGTGAKMEDFVEDGLDKANDALSTAMDLVGKGIDEIWSWFKKELGIDRSVASVDPKWLMQLQSKQETEIDGKAGSSFLKKTLDKFMETLSGGSVSPELVKAAAKLMNVDISAGDISHILNVIQHESGGSATVVNNWDSNAAKGTPSKGILQFIEPTFMSYAMPGHTNILNPLDQLLAMFNDTTWRSDLTLGGWGPSGGRRYANGGWADKLAIFGEVPGEPELAINPARDTSEGHIAEAIEARAKVNPNGFAGNLSKLIESAKQSAQNILPTFNGHSISSQQGYNASPTINATFRGNIENKILLDGKTVARTTYPYWKAIRSHEIRIIKSGGSIPVGNALPLGTAH